MALSSSLKRQRNSNSAQITFSETVENGSGLQRVRQNLLSQQKRAGSLLSQGKSRHLSSKRSSHEECKAIYQHMKDEQQLTTEYGNCVAQSTHSKWTQKNEPSFLSSSPYGNTMEPLAPNETVPEDPFTVKLCIKC